MAKREVGQLFFYRVPLVIKVNGRLYGSSPTTAGGIEAMLKRNMPSEAEIAFREGAGEEIQPLPELQRDIEKATEGIPVATTVFRRDEQGPYLHSNYLKGHLRECGETLSRSLNFWGLQGFVTKTVQITPGKLYILGQTGLEAWVPPGTPGYPGLGGKSCIGGRYDIRTATTFFAPEVRLSTGVTVRQPTEKIVEYVEEPILTWVLYLLGDPRWSRDLLEDMLSDGSMRGLGPGRGIDESKYDFELGEFEKLNRVDGRARYHQEFRKAGRVLFPIVIE